MHPAKGLSTLGNTGSVAQDIDMTQRTIRVQSLDECLQLLEGEQVGRLVYVDEGGPAAVPVNYVLDQGRVVFRTEAGSKTAALAGPIAFEVDRIDTGDQSGWSVLIRGRRASSRSKRFLRCCSGSDNGFPGRGPRVCTTSG